MSSSCEYRCRRRHSASLLTHSEAAARAFVDGAGATAHAELEARNAADGDTSYVKPFWDAMYLGGRYPVPIHSNPIVMFHPHTAPPHSYRRRLGAIYIL